MRIGDDTHLSAGGASSDVLKKECRWASGARNKGHAVRRHGENLQGGVSQAMANSTSRRSNHRARDGLWYHGGKHTPS